LGSLLALADVSLAGGVVSNCSEAGLLSALVGGGTVTFASDCNISLSTTIPINAAATIIDAGTNNVTIDGGNAVALFAVSGNLTLVGLTLAHGLSTNSSAGCILVHTGAGLNATSCNFVGNSVQGVNGFAGSNGFTNSSGTGGTGANGTAGTPAYGGAIYNLGNLTLSNCVFLTNSVIGGDGGNGGNGGDGGGTLSQGGNGGNGAAGSPGYGGAIYNLYNATLINCTFSNNFALGGNGGVGGTNGAGRYSGLDGSGEAGAAGSGGSVYNARNLTVIGCTFSTNVAESGISAPGGHQANGVGTTGVRGTDAFGGAICNTSVAVATNSTFYGNIAIGGVGGNGGDGTGSLPQGGNGGDGGNGVGGGLYNDNTLTVVNCTLSNNGAVGGANGFAGGGTFAGSNGKVGQSLGGNLAAAGGTLTLINSILNASASGANAYGGFTDGGHNLSSDSVSSFTVSTLQNTNPLLGPLANNGGETFTMALLAGSPAIDAIPPNLAPPVDQRGALRPQGPNSDIGAYEFTSSFVVLPISGQVLEGSTGLGGVTMTIYNGTTTNSIVTDANGFYTAALPPGSYTIEPTLANYLFQPQTLLLTVPPGTNANFATSPALTITRLTTKLIQLSTAGTTGLMYQIQTSTNLVNWQTISTNTAPVQFVDGISNVLARFYRLVLP
jgi:hypothetical protein